MNARRDLYAALMAGGPHSPQRSEKASELIDAFAAEVRNEAALDATVAHEGALPMLASPHVTVTHNADGSALLTFTTGGDL